VPGAKSISVVFQDASQGQIIVSTFSLTGGQWEAAPVPGTVISPTNTPTYVNYGGSAYDTIGGSIILGPASGGQITVTWAWASGSSASAGVTSQNLSGLAVSYTLMNIQTMNPTLQVVINNAAALSALALMKA
jgi:hypothetical protein